MRRTRMMTCAVAVVASVGGSLPAAAQTSPFDHLQVHGHLSQGYATSQDLPIFGIPTEGSTDYRNAALQFRYSLSDSDFAVIQFKHRRMAESVVTSESDNVELGWAFYQRRFGGGSVRLGRVPLPGGIFNEVRDVGTILPFYRAPGNFYIEGIETMDGAVGSYEVPIGPWSLEASVSYGGLDFKLPVARPDGPKLHVERVEEFRTAQLWVNTPIPGVRVGTAGATWKNDEGEDLWLVSVDATRDRGFLRGEYREVDFGELRANSYYAQGGLRLGPLQLNGQADFLDIQIPVTPIGPVQYQMARDLALGVNFVHSPNLVYKLEAHRTRGTNFDVFMDPMAGQGKTNYFIGSVSVSF